MEELVPFTVTGKSEASKDDRPELACQMVSPNYFQTVELPILRGRDFKTEDRIESQSVVIVDEALANRFFPAQDPLGKSITVSVEDEAPRECSIIGVVPHVRYESPDLEDNPFQAYFPDSQWDWDLEVPILRSDLDQAVLMAAVRQAVASIDPGVPVFRSRMYDDLIYEKLAMRRLAVLLAVLFSSAALFLATIGLYGVLSYSVSQRKREIGIRIAIGAPVSAIVRTVMKEGMRPVCWGLGIGILGALAVAELTERILFGVSVYDTSSLALAVIILAVSGLLACAIPALRAAQVDPVTTLRE